MKVWICAIAKMEELYIREWIEWHKKIGIDHIILGDNNDSDYDKPLYPIIQDYINEGYVELVNVNDQHGIQTLYYTNVYNKYKENFDWFLPIDIDEFINTNNIDIHDILNLPRFKNIDAIVVSWRNYGDNNILTYTPGLVKDLYTDELPIRKDNTIGCKTFYKSLKWCNKIYSMHSPQYNKDNKFIYCDVLGEQNFGKIIRNNNEDKFTRISYNKLYKNVMVLDHYITKSTEEFIKYKLLRGRISNKFNKFKYTRRYYYGYGNKVTIEKELLFKKYENQILQKLKEYDNFDSYCYILPYFNKYIAEKLNN